MVFQKKNKQVDEFEEQEKKIEDWDQLPIIKPHADLTHNTVGTYKDESTGRWYLITVQFNPETKDFGNFKMEHIPGDRFDAEERFKIASVELGCLP